MVFEGTFAALKKSGTKTGKHLAQHASLKTEYREAKGHLLVEKATLNNLRNVTVKIPKGVLTVVTGIAGQRAHEPRGGCFHKVGLRDSQRMREARQVCLPLFD